MRSFYAKVEDTESNSSIWIKFILNYSNELTLDNIVMSINQMLINNRPLYVFFEYPNILFTKETPLSYINNSNLSKLKYITTRDQDISYTQTFNTYTSLKDALFGLIGIANK